MVTEEILVAKRLEIEQNIEILNDLANFNFNSNPSFSPTKAIHEELGKLNLINDLLAEYFED